MSGAAASADADARIGAAFARLDARLAATPQLAARVTAWLRRLSPTDDPADYFRQPRLCPILTMPAWVEESLAGAADDAFQRELVYSTIAGYCHIRLIDDVMDGDAAADVNLLPASGFFHSEFTGTYARQFEPGHAFWPAFEALWFGAAEGAVVDAGLPGVTPEQFRAVSAQKVSPARIPIVAVCLRHERPDALVAWLDAAGALGEVAQLTDDVLDWREDLARGAATFFLSEAERRRGTGEGVTAWILREGFDWGVAELHDRYRRLHRQAEALGSAGLASHLTLHEQRLADTAAVLGPGFRALATLSGQLED
jgi:hypothetical protein